MTWIVLNVNMESITLLQWQQYEILHLIESYMWQMKPIKQDFHIIEHKRVKSNQIWLKLEKAHIYRWHK